MVKSMRGLFVVAIVGGLVAGCFGEVAEEERPWPSWSGGVSRDGSGPSYQAPTAKALASGEVTCGKLEKVGGSDDSCLGPPPGCDPGSLVCYAYESKSDLQGGSWGEDAMSYLEDGVAHYHSNGPRSEVTQSVQGADGQTFHATIRYRVSAATGNVTLARARLPRHLDDDVVFDLELVGATLRMCTPAPASGNPQCTDVGAFGRDVWHTVFFALDGENVLSARVDCGMTVKTTVTWYGEIEPDTVSSVDYGILWPTCASDVYVDLARGD